MAGVYARIDMEKGVHKAPANEVLRLAVGFGYPLDRAQQEVLNPEGINCLRFFEGRGYRLWGARTISSDPQWQYVNLRRYMNYLEHSIEKGTQWVAFENNAQLICLIGIAPLRPAEFVTFRISQRTAGQPG